MSRILLTAVGLMISGTACAQTSTTYEYDALGQLVGSTSQRTTANVRTTIEYDLAGNRKTFTVKGAGDGGDDSSSGASTGGSRKFIVVPLNGFTLIAID